MPKPWFQHVPNVLSGLRLILAGIFPWVPPSWRTSVVIAAGLTDFADGFLARRYRITSWTGGLLDAAADKLFALSVLLTLTMQGWLLGWQLLLLIVRDLTVAAIALYAAATRKWHAFRNMPARPTGKWTTASMFAFFIVVTAAPQSLLSRVLLLATLLLSLIASVDYFRVFIHARRLDKQRSAATSSAHHQ